MVDQSPIMHSKTPVRLEREGGIAVVVIDNPPVNAGSSLVRQGLLEAVRAIDGDATIVAAILIGEGGRFMSGSDLREFGKPLQPPELPAVIAAIEASQKPFVAALAGASLGGGYELALACDLRIADVNALVGLPEVTLGVIPGAGGTQRLPRLVGQAKAIGLICSGARAIIETVRAERNVERATFDERAIVTRVLVTIVNEAALLRRQGIAERATDVDVVYVHGYGFPRHEGGPLYWTTRQSPDTLSGALDQIAAASGPAITRGPIDELLGEVRAASNHV